MAKEKEETAYLTGTFHLKNGNRPSETIAGNVAELNDQRHCIESILRKEPGRPAPALIEFGNLYVFPEEICAVRFTLSSSPFGAICSAICPFMFFLMKSENTVS